jgi:hypothetical protein
MIGWFQVLLEAGARKHGQPGIFGEIGIRPGELT